VSSAKVLVLTCIDPRFTELLSWFLIHVKQIHSSYDLFALAGSSLGVVQARATNVAQEWPRYPNWDDTFFDHVKLAVVLHGIEEIWLFDHLGCAAYTNFLLDGEPDNDPVPHNQTMNQLRGFISAYTNDDQDLEDRIKNLRVSGFIMGLDGTVTKSFGHATPDLQAYNIACEKKNCTTNGIWVAVVTVLIVGIFSYLRKK
jgi:hypothetical protein